MRKVLFTAAAFLFTVCAASAQESVVKEAKKAKGDPAKAAQIIEPALTDPSTANDPETWKLAGDFQKSIYDDENMKSTVVPFRNGIMLSVAAGLAESHGLKRLFIANHFGDHAIYPDCRAGFIKAMSEAVSEGTYEHIRIEAPYTGISKTDIAKRGAKLGINYAETWSCYKGGEKHCGKCGTCMERKEAFREAGLTDPTIYEE